jgi:hypothetical protein
MAALEVVSNVDNLSESSTEPATEQPEETAPVTDQPAENADTVDQPVFTTKKAEDSEPVKTRSQSYDF